MNDDTYPTNWIMSGKRLLVYYFLCTGCHDWRPVFLPLDDD